jgi:hypothetical protein
MEEIITTTMCKKIYSHEQLMCCLCNLKVSSNVTHFKQPLGSSAYVQLLNFRSIVFLLLPIYLYNQWCTSMLVFIVIAFMEISLPLNHNF